ncbi:MAG TPA: addiction module protein [Usitatibacter sp.]|nr:addiction module protein [Usitatibacter sp.]
MKTKPSPAPDIRPKYEFSTPTVAGNQVEVVVARSFAEIQSELCDLSFEERAKLALALVESLEGEDQGDIAEAWRVEAERRSEQHKRGEVQAIPADEVFARIRSRA